MPRKYLFLALAALASSPATAPAQDKVDFKAQILPLFEERCMSCHREPYEDERGRIKKPKGELRMDNPEGFKAGGENGDIIVAGKPEEGTLIKLVSLPEDDDDVMPPEGKADHLTDAEIALLKKWISEGAEFGDWTGTKFDAEGNKVE